MYKKEALRSQIGISFILQKDVIFSKSETQPKSLSFLCINMKRLIFEIFTTSCPL